MKKRYFGPHWIFILFVCISLGFMVKSQIVKADLMLDGRQIDGSCAIYFDQQPLREIQYNGTVVWRAGADITYSIDSDIYEIHFVPYGQTTLSVTGSKEEYEFIGWREDTTASGEVLETDLCTGDEKTLYAVFQKAVTVTYYNGSSTPQTSVEYIYYNNGNTSNPEFTINQAALSGWTAVGWSTGQAANAEVSYCALNGTTFTTDMTLYGIYQKTITASFDGNGFTSGSIADMTASAYYNSSGNTINPSFEMPKDGFTKEGYVLTGWLQGSTEIIRAVEESVTLSSDTIFTAQWQSNIIDFSYTGDAQEWTVPLTGYYQLETWGASGGAAKGDSFNRGKISLNDVKGGTGGYACGYQYLTEGTILYIYVGGEGGFNGGSAGGDFTHMDHVSYQIHHNLVAGGGGATHIALRLGELKTLENYTSDILLVAGGGGGGMDNYEPDENDDYDIFYGIPGGSGGINIGSGNISGFGQSSNQVGTGGGYHTGDKQSGGSNYIGGVLSSLNYNEQTYTSKSTTSSHTGNGAVTITYLGR